jgi:hypothetical protein
MAKVKAAHATRPRYHLVQHGNATIHRQTRMWAPRRNQLETTPARECHLSHPVALNAIDKEESGRRQNEVKREPFLEATWLP